MVIMENDPLQQPQNQPVQQPQVPGPVEPAPVQQPQIQPLVPGPAEPELAPQKKVGNYIVTAFGVLILLTIFLPKSSLAQSLAFPVIILGAVAGIKFIIDAIRSSRTKPALVRLFFIFGGFGVGIFIFIACVIAGTIIGFSKDPNPQGCG